ncbi:MAG: hypothetical protein AAGC55_00370, partial [Myxococcota bacterium]
VAALVERDTPLWICVLAQPSFEQQRPDWALRCASRYRAELGPLDDDAATALCLSLLQPAERIPTGAIARLVARSEGIPLFLAELVGGLKAEGVVRQQTNGSWFVATDELDRMPNLPIVEWLATRALDSMSPGLVAHARLVALLGAEFTASEVAGVVDELDRARFTEYVPLDPAVATRRLLGQRMLVSRSGQPRRYRFRYSLLRDEISRSTPEALRAEIHRAAYRYYDRANHLPERYRMARLAFHGARSEQRERAGLIYLELAARARARHEYLDAESLYSLALELVREDDDASRTAAYWGRSLMRYRLGRYQDALVDFVLARTLAAHRGEVLDEIAILLDEATALDWCDEWSESHKRVEQARALAQARSSPLIEARLLLARGRSACRQSRDGEALELMSQAADHARSLGDEAYETRVIALIMNGYILASMDHPEESAACFDRVVPLCEERGDSVHLAAALGNRAMLWLATDDHERMITDLEQLRELARELGNGRLEQHAHYYLAQYLHWIGEFELAEQQARRAMEIDNRRFAGAARHESAILVARILVFRGQYGTVRTILGEIRQRQKQAVARSGPAVELVPYEEVMLAAVDLASSDSFDEHQWRMLRERAALVFQSRERLEVLEMWAQAAHRHGHLECGRAVVADALELAETSPAILTEHRTRLLRLLGQLDENG